MYHSLSGTDVVLIHIKFFLCFCNIGYFSLSTIFTVLMPIDDLAEIDYSLNSLPAVSRPYIDLDLKVIACSASANINGFFCSCMILFLRLKMPAVLNTKTLSTTAFVIVIIFNKSVVK